MRFFSSAEKRFGIPLNNLAIARNVFYVSRSCPVPHTNFAASLNQHLSAHCTVTVISPTVSNFHQLLFLSGLSLK